MDYADQSTPLAKRGANYTLFQSGKLRDWIDNSVEIPGLGKVQGKLFLKDIVGFTSCEMSINAMPAGQGMPFHHTHAENEEVYIFISGHGQVQVDGITMDVSEGSILRVAPSGVRTWRNNSAGSLVYIVIQMRDQSLRQYGLGDGLVQPGEPVWPA